MTNHASLGAQTVRVLDGTPEPPLVFDDSTLLPADPRVLAALRSRVEGADLAAAPGGSA